MPVTYWNEHWREDVASIPAYLAVAVACLPFQGFYYFLILVLGLIGVRISFNLFKKLINQKAEPPLSWSYLGAWVVVQIFVILTLVVAIRTVTAIWLPQ